MCIAKWRALPKSFHHDQLNMAELGFYLQENTWRSCLQLEGLLTLNEAHAIQSLIISSAEQAGETLNQRDWESAYILNWQDNEFSHHKAALRTVRSRVVELPLPFPTTINWSRTESSWSIRDDKVVDRTGALEKWCTRKWGAGEMGIWRELQEENTEHLRHADKLLFWSKRAWFIIWTGTLDYLLPIGCELLLAIITEKEDQRDQNTSVEDKLSSWRALPTEYYNDQLNLCRYYSAMGASILAEGLRLRELISGHAHDIAEIIWKNAEENNTLLSTAYSGILKGNRVMEKQFGARRRKSR